MTVSFQFYAEISVVFLKCRVAPSGLVQPDEPWLQQHERGAAMGRDRPSVQWLKAGARQLCQAGSVQSQHGCACTPELLLVRSTQVHSTEMLE